MATLFKGARLIEAGVDWITATGKDNDECDRIIALGEELQESDGERGGIPKATGFQGYRGYSGEGWFYGTRNDGALLRLSGAMAHDNAPRLAAMGAHITRLDLQLTVDVGKDDRDLPKRLVYAIRNDRGGTASSHRSDTRCVDSGIHGVTAYLGTRASPFFGRVYDKHRESHGRYPVGAFRLESETKRTAATATLERCAEHGFSRGAIVGLLKSQFQKRGIVLAVKPSIDVDAPIVPRVLSDVDRKLAWLANTAAPVVRALHDAGYSAGAAAALYSWLQPEAPETGLD